MKSDSPHSTAVDRCLRALRLVLLIVLGRVLFSAGSAASSFTRWPAAVMILTTSGVLVLVIVIRCKRRRVFETASRDDVELVEHESGESFLESIHLPIMGMAGLWLIA